MLALRVQTAELSESDQLQGSVLLNPRVHQNSASLYSESEGASDRATRGDITPRVFETHLNPSGPVTIGAESDSMKVLDTLAVCCQTTFHGSEYEQAVRTLQMNPEGVCQFSDYTIQTVERIQNYNPSILRNILTPIYMSNPESANS